MKRFLAEHDSGSIWEVLKLKKNILLATIVFCLIITNNVTSQDVAVGSATVIGVQGITITSPQELDFGDILQGIPKSIGNNDISAGIFEISGQNEAGVNLQLQLPEYLFHTGSGSRLRIIFGDDDVSIDTTGAGNPPGMDAGKGWQNENPFNLPAATIGSNGTDIYIGGKVVPSANQKAGDYTGSIVLIVAYNDL